MSTLTSASTDTQVRAAYDDNSSYEEDASVAKAQAFVTACRILISRLPSGESMEQASVQRNLALLRDELAAAQRWLATHRGADQGGSGVRHLSMQDFRG